MTQANSNNRNGEDRKQTILQTAAVFRDGFSIDWLIHITKEKPSAVLDILEMAVQNNDLTRNGYSRFQFSNKAVHDAFLSKVPDKQKADVYLKIAEFLEEDLPEGEEKANLISEYLMNVSNDLNTCKWLSKAGDAYLKTHNLSEALKCYQKVLKDLSAIEDPEAESFFIKTTIKYSRYAELKFDYSHTQSFLMLGLQYAKKKQDLKSAALLQMHMAKNEWYRSNFPAAFNFFQKGWQTAQTIEDRKFQLAIITFSTFFHYWQGCFKEAVSLYEAEISANEAFSHTRFNLMAQATLGNCYIMIGDISQGLGIINAVRSRIQGSGSTFIEAFHNIVMAISLLTIEQVDEAGVYTELVANASKRWPGSPVAVISHLLTAYVAFIKGNHRRAAVFLKKFLSLRDATGISMWPYPYVLELGWAVECKQLTPVKGFSLEYEIEQAVKSKNVFYMGMAYRYQALLQQKSRNDRERVYDLLKKSEDNLITSGHFMELYKTRQIIQDQYAAKAGDLSYPEINRVSPEMIPDQLKPILKKEQNVSNMLLRLAQIATKAASIADEENAMSFLLNSVNRMIGSERSAVFLKESSPADQEMVLFAASNLTGEQMSDQAFNSARMIIQEVFRTGIELMYDSENRNLEKPREKVFICVPLVKNGNIIGACYHDNSFTKRNFTIVHMSILQNMAALMVLMIDYQKQKQELLSIKKGMVSVSNFSQKEISRFGIIGQSRAIQKVINLIKQVADTDATVIILGETGTGKELVAKALHQQSARRKNPFVEVNCNALPDSLISSELFGHEKGSFTGALQKRTGRFELANHGTLFLDEIGELPLETQVKLLRILQTRKFERIGGVQTLTSDFRLITATHRNIEEAVAQGRFREDLFYRLNIFPITVPPLRQRKEDIPLLAHYFLQQYSMKQGKQFCSFPETEMEKLLAYEWPGNVRELENVIERGTILSQSDIFIVPELSSATPGRQLSKKANKMTLMEVEKHHILSVLKKTTGKIRGHDGAAKILDIHPSTLYSRMKKLGIS